MQQRYPDYDCGKAVKTCICNMASPLGSRVLAVPFRVFRTPRLRSRAAVALSRRSTSTQTESPHSEFNTYYARLQSQKLYDTHIPTTPFQKTILMCGSAIGSFVAPERDNMIALFGETSGYLALQCMRERMLRDETGREILRLKPRINTQTVNLEALRQLPSGTFGREYVMFMDARNFTPDSRKEVKYVDNAELAYVMLRYRQLHDFTHTLLQMPTSLYGEIIVKWFEGIQTGLPMCILGGILAPLRLPAVKRQELYTVYVPWAISTGWRAKFLMNVYFEQHFEEPTNQLRRRLGIIPPPRGSLTLYAH